MIQLNQAEELLTLLSTQPSVRDGLKEMSVIHGEIIFHKISFSYDGKKEVIKNFSLHITPGQTIAFVGETGAGKSTIFKLLFRLYDAVGSISIDGQEISDVTLSSLRESIGIVPQDPGAFNDTILANIRYARLDATDEEVKDACRLAAIHDKIESLTEGYSTKVGENGVALSGGELQRLAIARVFLKNPKIILLDEATSSVDSETEARIQAALRKLTAGRTTIMIAHRLSTIMNADRIVVIKEGQILEQGAPAALMAAGGMYHGLWLKQSGAFRATTQ
jgi:ABC-type multidrug transport system fused ATPase/permease subunit